MYIAIEGIKGVGKSTTIEYLSNNILKNHEFYFLKPTSPMPRSHMLEMIYPYLKYFDFYREELYTHRSNYHARKINWYDKTTIISDRSIITSLAIRWHRNHNKIDYFKKIRKKEYIIPVPDIVIQLHLSKNEIMQRYNFRVRNYGKHEENEMSIEQISKNFSEIQNWLQNPQTVEKIGFNVQWVNIHCDGKSIESIASDILKNIKSLNMPTSHF